jgi:hypothetical protein
LRQVLVDHFDVDELKTLCVDLGEDYQALPGEGKVSKARELVAYFERRNRVSELLAEIRKARPDVPLEGMA